MSDTLNRIERQLDSLKASVQHMTLGLRPSPFDLDYLYVNGKHGGVWYRVLGGEEQVEESGALRGMVLYARKKVKTRRGEEKPKLVLTVQGDRRYMLEIGWGTHTSRSILGALSEMSEDALREPVVLTPRKGDDEEMAIFINVEDAWGNRPYNFIPKEKLDWALEKVQRLLGMEEETEPHEEAHEEQERTEYPGSQLYDQGPRDIDVPENVLEAVKKMVEVGRAHEGETLGSVETEKGTLAERVLAMSKYLKRSNSYLNRICSLYDCPLANIPAPDGGGVLGMLIKESRLIGYEERNANHG